MSGVAFQQIPADFIPPLFYVEFNNSLAGEVGQTSQPALAIGQTINAQSAVPVYIPSYAYAAQLFGNASMLARMCKVYFAADPIGPLYALPLADASGATAASGSIAFTGAATSSGAIYLYVAGQLVRTAVAIGDQASAIATNVAAAVNAASGLPVTAAATTDTVTFTAVHKGALGNSIPLELNVLGARLGQQLPGGVTAAITAMTGGATDPDLAGVAAAIGDQEFDFIFHPYAAATPIGEMTSTLSDNGGRWAWDRQSYGHAFTALNDTLANMLTLVDALNDQHGTLIQNSGLPFPPWDVVADVIGTVAPSIRNIASQPLQTLLLNTVFAGDGAVANTLAEEQQLLSNGASVLRFDRYGKVSIGQLVTTYKTNAQGQPDASYRYVTTMFTLMAITRQIKAALVTKFARSILVPNGTRGNPNVPYVTPNAIRAEIAAQYDIMERNGLVVNASAMIAATSVTIDSSNPNRANIVWRPELANGLDMLAMINQFVLNPAAAA